MTAITYLDTPTLTDDQQIALDLVEARPGLTVEDYCGDETDLYSAFYWLAMNRYIFINPITQSVTVKG